MTIQKQNFLILIRPAKGWVALDLKELWEYRDLLWFLIVRDVKARYRQMALGALWILLQPVGQMIIFTFIFGTLAKLPTDGIPYPLFSYSGLLIWGYFDDALNSATGSLRQYMNMISKVYFPRLVVPLVAVLSGLIDLAVKFLVLVLLMVIYGYSPTAGILLFPLYLLLTAMTALSIGLWSAALTVRYHDVGILVRFIVRFWFYLTPVAYATSTIPEEFLILYKLNPMYWAVEGFRWGLLGHGGPPELLMLAPTLLVMVLLIGGLFFFRRTELNVVDWL